MKEKITRGQLKLNLFPIEGVAAVNEASIRDFHRAYWEHSDDGTRVRDTMSDAFIKRLAMDAAESKTELREMMARSPYWRESLQAWVIPITHTVEISPSRVFGIIGNMWGDCRDNLDVQSAAYYFLPGGENNDFAKAAIERLTGREQRGRKSKIFQRLSKALGGYTTDRGSLYQRNESKLFKLLAAPFEGGAFKMQEKDVLYVSINPAHFLSMSNPKGDDRGEMMTSCHSFNSHYRTRSGCIGYARDKVSLIAFTAAGNGDALLNRKTARQLFMYQNGALLQSRLYTSRAGSYGGVGDAEHWEYSEFLKVIQAEIARCEHAKRGWSIPIDYRNRKRFDDGEEHNPDNRRGLKLNRFGVEIFSEEEFGGYLDWEQFSDCKGMIRVCVLKNKLNRGKWVGQNQGMFAGESGLNVRTGEEIYAGDSITA